MIADVLAAQARTKPYISGKVVVPLGPSGSGKSTLLSSMDGLDQTTGGRMFFKTSKPTELKDRGLTAFRHRHVRFRFQFYNLAVSLTAYENVALVTRIVEGPVRPEEAPALVGLQPRMDYFSAQLPGGEQQLVAIARALTKCPEGLMCDEPTGALDSGSGIAVDDPLLASNAELGTTLIITYNAAIKAVADRVTHFPDGRVSRNERRRVAAELSW
jgi:putative ABC transport system ATP-binding protein